MDNEQAAQAVQHHEAASPEGEAGNQRERAMTSLLAQMTPSDEVVATGEAPISKEAMEMPEAEVELEVKGVQEAQEAEEGAEDSVLDDSEKKARNFRGRWDHLNEEERRVVELTTKRGLTLGEAYRAVYGVEGGKIPEASVPAGESGAHLEAAIAASEARLEGLKLEREGVKGDAEAYDKAVEAYLGEREALMELRLKRQLLDGEEVQRQNRQREEAAREAREAVAAEFPEALVPGTELYEACQDELAYLKETGSPLTDDPQVAYKVARRLARLLGRRGEAPLQVPKRTMRPLPAGGVPAEAPLATLERRLSGARSPGAMLDLMREFGTPIEALMRR